MMIQKSTISCGYTNLGIQWERQIILNLTAIELFDTVVHDFLLEDLRLAGICGTALQWFRSYLQDRPFRVIIDDVVSEVGTMTTGVPQGSVMGPILYSVYTTELGCILDELGVSYHFYADDTQIYLQIRNLVDERNKIESILQIIKRWMISKKLKINPDKTEIIIFGSRHRLNELDVGDSFTLDDSRITLSSKVRSLGVVMDETLSLKEHIRSMKGKLIFSLINIARISKYLNRNHKMQLVHTLILSRTDFCNAILYRLPDSDLRPLQLIINSAARLVIGMPRFSVNHITPVLIDLHILPIKARIKYKICTIVYKALKFEEPKYLWELLQRRTALPSLRQSSARFLEEPLYSASASSDRCFAHCAPRLYNTLPASLQAIDSYECFRRQLKTFIFSETFDLENETVNDPFKL